MIPAKNCELFSARGRALVHIAAYPDCTIEGVADALCLSPRTVWGIMGELRRAHMIGIRKEGRRHHYAVNLGTPFRHTTVQGYNLWHILEHITDARQLWAQEDYS